MAFEQATRLKFIAMPTLARPAGGGITTQDMPRSGILAGIFLNIQGTLGGTLTVGNKWGLASIIRRVRLTLNSGVDVINISGPGYHWLLRDFINLYLDPVPQSNGRLAVLGATTVNLDMVLPISVNNRDMVGALMLQNEQTLATLSVEWEADTTVASAPTFTTFTCKPELMMFEVPVDPKDWPPLNVLHQIIEDQQSVAAAGDFTYVWPRGNTYLGVYHILQTQTYTQARLRVQQSIFLEDFTPQMHRLYLNTLICRDSDIAAGTLVPTGSNVRVAFDFLGTDGLGAYGSIRDPIDSSRLTDLASIITEAGGADTLLSIRRQLITLA